MTNPDGSLSGTAKRGIGAIVVLLLLITSFFMFTVRVDAGQACTKLTFGAATGQAGSGLHLKMPIVQKYACYTGTVQTLDVVMGNPNEIDSKATYKDVYIEGKTNTGVTYFVSLSLSYVVPLDNVKAIYKTVGKTDAAVFQKGVNNPLRVITRQVLNTKSADDLYYGNLEALSTEVASKLTAEMQKYGITLQFFGIKAFDFDDSYENRIKAKNEEIENAKLVELQQTTATETAEKQRIEAEGNKQAAIIDAERDAEKMRIGAQGEADSVTIAANAEAEAINLRGTALAANPTVLEWETIGAIRSANVIYLPSDVGILPIMDIGDNSQTAP